MIGWTILCIQIPLPWAGRILTTHKYNFKSLGPHNSTFPGNIIKLQSGPPWVYSQRSHAIQLPTEAQRYHCKYNFTTASFILLPRNLFYDREFYFTAVSFILLPRDLFHCREFYFTAARFISLPRVLFSLPRVLFSPPQVLFYCPEI